MIGQDIKKAKELLLHGEVIGVPTETVYGLAANALDPTAVAKIFQVKNRPTFDPLIVHVGRQADILTFANKFPPLLRQVATKFMPGPVTLLLEKKSVIPDIVTSGLSKVAIRVPAHPMFRALLLELDFPLAAPSANPFGYISPTSATHVEAQFGDKVPYILDGGDCEVGIESTIVGEEDGHLVVFRKGGLAIEELLKIDPNLVVREHSNSNPNAPGMLDSHYAPTVPLILSEDFDLTEYTDQKIGIISFDRVIDGVPRENQFILSKARDYSEAAKNLFANMRQLDQLDLDVIIAQLLPEENLGRAINDRLRRAAFKW